MGTKELVSAVSNGGGLGILGTGHATPQWAREEIGKLKQLTTKPFAVNIVLISPLVNELVDVVCQEKVPVITTGGDNPCILIRTYGLNC